MVEVVAVSTPLQKLRHINNWLFDLDNTLYPATCNLQQQMSVQAQRLFCELLGTSTQQARELQTTYMREYGTPLHGLIKHHGVTPEVYFDYIHDVDYLVVKSNPALNLALEGLQGRKFVFTNGTADHAHRVLNRLGCAAQFDGIFDIVAADYEPKPEVAVYRRVAKAVGGDLSSIALVEDVPENLRPAAALGMTTVWVRNASEFSHGKVGEHIHIITDDLVSWLTEVTFAQIPSLRTVRTHDIDKR